MNLPLPTSPVPFSSPSRVSTTPASVHTNRKNQFDAMCLRINIDSQTTQEAWKLLEGFYALCSQIQESEHLWPVCAIYVVATKAVASETTSGVPLSQMLRDCNTRLYDFFKPLQTFITTLQLNAKIYERLQLKYIVVTLLYEKYQDLYCKHFKVDIESIQRLGSTPRKSDPTEKIYKFGWYLFLLAKGKLLSNSGDFVTCLHLMLSCLNLLLLHMPEIQRKRPLKEIFKFVEQQNPCQPPDTLFYWCHSNHANYDQVKDMQDRIFNAWVKTLCDNKILHYQPAKIPPDPALSNRFYLGGLLDSALEENEKSLNKEYEVLLYDTCDFDERLFVERNDHIQSPLRPTTTPHTTIPGLLMTPAKAALNANDWLIKTLSSVEDGPTCTGLKEFLVVGDKDYTPVLQERINKLLELVDFQAENAERKGMVCKLYYRILQAILTSESKRLNCTDFGALLSQDLFNKSLLAGALEIVICSYRTTSMKFPWVLQKFEISPFEFYTIIECIIKHEPKLPHVVRKHLIRIEERILEEMAWESTSPVYTGLTPEQQSLLLERLKLTTGTPKKIHQHACQNFASPAKVNTAGRIHKKIELFMRKVAHLAHLRIHELVGELNKEGVKIRPAVVQQIEYVFMYVITQTILVMDRHIDQLIMCIVYGICKINRITITFKQIIEKYLGQPQANSQTYRVVRISGATKFGDIIKFYNSIFLTSLEPFLLEFEFPDEQNRDDMVEPTALNLRVYSPLKLHKSPQKIHNLLVSPRRTPLLLRDQTQSKAGNANSLVLGSLKSWQSDFDRINSTINNKTNTPTKAKRRLDYSTSDTENITNTTTPPNAATTTTTSTTTAVPSTPTLPAAAPISQTYPFDSSETRQHVAGLIAAMAEADEDDEIEEDDEEDGDEIVDDDGEDDNVDEEEDEDTGRVEHATLPRKRKQDEVVSEEAKKTKKSR